VQAPGPLYQMVHYAFKPFTQYKVFCMRIVSFILLLLSMWLLSLPSGY